MDSQRPLDTVADDGLDQDAAACPIADSADAMPAEKNLAMYLSDTFPDVRLPDFINDIMKKVDVATLQKMVAYAKHSCTPE